MTPVASTVASESSRPSWLASPTIVTWSPSDWCTASTAGISSTHGAHHEAKKFTTTGFPVSRSPRAASGWPVSDSSRTSAVEPGSSPCGVSSYPSPLAALSSPDGCVVVAVAAAVEQREGAQRRDQGERGGDDHCEEGKAARRHSATVSPPGATPAIAGRALGGRRGWEPSGTRPGMAGGRRAAGPAVGSTAAVRCPPPCMSVGRSSGAGSFAAFAAVPATRRGLSGRRS